MTETVVGPLLSVNVGLPNDIAWHGETVHTAVWKRAVSGRRIVRRLNLDGDGQGDLIGHGGEQRAVLVYQIDCYRYWERELGRDDFDCGQFGENFTVEGLPDAGVCIGDRYRIGSALFEVRRAFSSPTADPVSTLSARSARIPGRRQPAYLLLATAERRGHRSLSGSARVENA
jgi:hypothetical protein